MLNGAKKEIEMQNFVSQEKIRIIQESTEKQLLELEILKKTGAMDAIEADKYKKIIIEVFIMQKETLCA